MVDGVDDKQAGDMDQAEEADIEDAEGARVAPRDATLLTLFSDCPPPVPRRATHHASWVGFGAARSLASGLAALRDRSASLGVWGLCALSRVHLLLPCQVICTCSNF